MRSLSLVAPILLAGCVARSDPPPTQSQPQVPIAASQAALDPYATTGTGAAAVLTPREREAMAARLAEDPAFTVPESAQDFDAEIKRLLDELGIEPVEGRTAQDWRRWNGDRRIEELVELKERGNPWSAAMLDELHAGHAMADALGVVASKYELEVRLQRFREAHRPIGEYPSEPALPEPSMPFGDGMFGPWDTGSGERGR